MCEDDCFRCCDGCNCNCNGCCYGCNCNDPIWIAFFPMFLGLGAIIGGIACINSGNVGAGVGALLTGVAIIALCIIGCLWLRQRNQQRRAQRERAAQEQLLQHQAQANQQRDKQWLVAQQGAEIAILRQQLAYESSPYGSPPRAMEMGGGVQQQTYYYAGATTASPPPPHPHYANYGTQVNSYPQQQQPYATHPNHHTGCTAVAYPESPRALYVRDA